jgi:ATP-grasp domain, R2K clade family 3
MEKDELNAARKEFDCVSLLSDIQPGDYVVPRYSLFPFPFDQEQEILNLGATLINSYEQHLYVADLQNYVPDLGALTPYTWDNLYALPEVGPFVLKGATNSRKSHWDRDMFAPTKQDAIRIHSRLSEDGLIGQQHIYIRQYVPLTTYAHGLGGIPITKEFRFFVAFGKVLCSGYYWQNYADELLDVPKPSEVPQSFLQTVIDRVAPNINFFVMDIAETQSGEWLVIELNDGQCSGLSCIDPNHLYSNLKEVINDQLIHQR